MAVTKKAWLIPLEGASGVKRIPELEGKELSLKDLYPIIGNGCHLVERVQLKKGVEMWVDEEGLLKENWMNLIGTHLYQKAYPHIDPSEIGVVGVAIIIDNTKAGDFILG